MNIGDGVKHARSGSMRGFSFAWLVALLMLLIAGANAALAQEVAAGSRAGYKFGPGDHVSIQVFGEPELSIKTQVAENGRLTYPFLGEIEVSGLTSSQLEKEISAGLEGDFLVDPKVSVTITEYRPVFVNGQVKSPGSFPYQPGLTIRKALSLAGGLTERASEKRVTVISENDKAQGRSKGRNVGLEEFLAPGDIVTVAESFF